MDSGGSLYIAEPSFNRILRLSNGVLATVAGGGPVGYSGDNGPVTDAELNLPGGIAVDSADNLYIARFLQQSRPGGREWGNHDRGGKRVAGL